MNTIAFVSHSLFFEIEYSQVYYNNPIHYIDIYCISLRIVGRRIEIFLRLKVDGKIVLLVTSVASFAKVLYVNKS